MAPSVGSSWTSLTQVIIFGYNVNSSEVGQSGVLRYDYDINGGGWNTVTGILWGSEFYSPVMSEGINVVNVRAVDRAGNIGVSNFTRVYMDHTGPQIKIGPVDVDHGETGCKTPDAMPYIERIWERKSRKSA